MNGILLTLEEFDFYRSIGAINEYDGTGYYSEIENDTTIVSSDDNVWSLPAPDWATHVMWYNK